MFQQRAVAIRVRHDDAVRDDDICPLGAEWPANEQRSRSTTAARPLKFLRCIETVEWQISARGFQPST
jgi:hypothetical protein